MVFLNKNLMSSKDRTRSIPAPIFITGFQCFVTALICWILGHLGRHVEKNSFFAQFPVQEYSFNVSKQVLPLSLIFVGMVTFNNLCLQYVEVSFYNVARSLTIVFNVIFTFFFLGENTSWKTMITLFIVILGFFVGSDGETNFSLVGTLFGVVSSVFVSLNSIYVKKMLVFCDDNMWKLTFYNNVNAVVLFGVVLLTGSGEVALLKSSTQLLIKPAFWLAMSITGVFGFMIGIVSTLQIKVTSPLTHNISGTAKACLQTILALLYYQNDTTVQSMLGVFVVIFGSLAYAYVRMDEDKKARINREQTKADDVDLGDKTKPAAV